MTKRNKEYDAYLKINEEMLERTDSEYAPWTIIEATDRNYASMKILKSVTEQLERALEEKAGKKAVQKVSSGISLDAGSRYQNGVLSGVDLSKALTREEYKEKLDKLQKSTGLDLRV